MNAHDILKYGNLTLHHTLARVPQEDWLTAGVCGVWSVKQIVAHLASFELVLIDILTTFPTQPDTHLFTSFAESGQKFNDVQVPQRDGYSAEAALAEYDSAHSRVMELIAGVSERLMAQPGTLPWYGAEYALDDFLVYTFYGHKREHSAQVAVFADFLAGESLATLC